MGRLVEALCHSRFWADTCLFAIEDDPQSGWDHLSGYRTTCYVASPYTKRRQTISTPYNQAEPGAHHRVDPRLAAHEPDWTPLPRP